MSSGAIGGAAVALVLVATWITLYVAARRRAGERDAVRARGANLAMLAATVLASVGTCAAPVGALVAAFGDVARARPGEKTALLERSIDATRPISWLALASIPILVAGSVAFVSNRRRLARLASRSPVSL